MHGLEGSSQSKYILSVINYLNAQKFDCVAVNFRGCSGEMNHKIQAYNSGKTDTYISSNIIRIPIDIRFANYKREKFTSFLQAGISLDFPIGQPKIRTKNNLNNPDRFRDNISQGAHSESIVLSGRIEGGFSLKTDKSIIEPKFFYIRSLTDIYPGSNYSFFGISFSFIN